MIGGAAPSGGIFEGVGVDVLYNHLLAKRATSGGGGGVPFLGPPAILGEVLGVDVQEVIFDEVSEDSELGVGGLVDRVAAFACSVCCLEGLVSATACPR